MAIDIKPLRQYSEHEVVNLFAYAGTISTTAGAKVNKGSVVKITGDGFQASDDLDMIGSVGASYNGTVSQRYGVVAKMNLCQSGDTPLGIMLNSVAEVDENGELLKFNPRKAAEMQVALSGQSVPILTRGIILYSGALTSSDPGANVAIYATDAGELSTSSTGKVKVGKTLGIRDDNGYVLIKIEL